MSKYWKWFIPGHIWLLPETIGFALFAFSFYGARSWGFARGVLTFISGCPMIGHPAGQTIGACKGFKDTLNQQWGPINAHENTHIVEAMVAGAAGQLAILPITGFTPWALLGGFIGGALYSVVYIVAFLSYYLTTQKDEKPGWVDDYRRNFLEVIANRAQARYVAATPEEKAGMWA